MKATGHWFVVVALTVAAAAAAGCGAEGEETEGHADEITERPDRVAWATPEWSGRKAWYTTSQGSFLIEDDIFMALERADSSTPFVSPASLEPLGFLYPPPGVTDLTSGPRVPLGVVRDRKPGENTLYAGFTCAACHTGVVDTPDKKTRLLIDGGQGFVNLSRFLGELRDALDAASSDPSKRAHVCEAIGNPANCNARIETARQRVKGLLDRNRDGASPEGPGRVDALTREANEIFSSQLAHEPTYTLDAPISLPQIWDAPRLSCLQTNCIPLDPLSRNVSEQIAVFGETKLHRDGSWIVAEGTAELENLYTLEHSLVSLASPRWTGTSLPSLDAAKVRHGMRLFESRCASCHTEPYRSDAPSTAFKVEEVAGHTTKVWKATAWPLDEVGTDSAFLDRHFDRFVSDPLLIDVFNQKIWNAAAARLGLDPRDPFASIVIAPAVGLAKAGLATQGFYDFWGNPLELAVYGALTDVVIDDELARMEPDEDKRAALRNRYEFFRQPSGSATAIQKYKARPLNGIAFTAPFGHNGAWPTLRDVLEPPSSRPKSFVIRPGSFDADRVGLDIRPAKPGENLFVFDTAKAGNTAGGHTYGTDLSASEKDALLEYLKSI